MELNVKLTADELMNVVDAAMDEAIDRGYDADDETVDDMLHIVDAALSAMGIEIVPADEDDEDEEEDNDPIADMLYVLDDGRTAISFEDACFLMDMIKETGMERGLSEDEATEAAQHIFIQIGKDYGIDVVEEDEEEEDEPEEQEYPDNPVSRCVFIYDGKRAIKKSDADQIVEAMTEVIDLRLGFLLDELKQKVRADMLLKVFEENGVEIVVKDE
jgi:hypothetical protein